MKYILESHPSLEMIDPIIDLDYTIDYLSRKTFKPVLLFKVDTPEITITISHELPEQPYVNGTWVDEDVNDAMTNYLNSIQTL